MKKTFILVSASLIISFIFALCSCRNKDICRFEPEHSFSVHMTAKKSDRSFEADISFLSPEDAKILFTEPEQLFGFQVTLSGDEYTVDAFGKKNILNKKEINDSSMLELLIDTLKISVYSNHEKFIKTEKGYSAELSINGISVDVFFSPDGYIKSMSAEEEDFYAEFTR